MTNTALEAIGALANNQASQQAQIDTNTSINNAKKWSGWALSKFSDAFSSNANNSN